MDSMSRWLAPAVMAVGIASSAGFPAHARDDDAFIRVLVDVADVVLRGGAPYYRHGSFGHDDRLVVDHDRHGRPVYYRQVPPHYFAGDRYYDDDYRREVRCNSHGKCKLTYYDPRYDRHRYRHPYDHRHYERGW